MAKQIRIYSPGSWDKLKIENFTPILPGKNDVQIEIFAFGVNYADICVRWGIYESAKKFVGWPISPGFEFSGTVKSVGKDVNNFKIGDKVFGVSFFNSYATHVTVPDHQIYKVPNNISMEQAAGIPAVFLTAYHALFQNVYIRPNSNILVHSAAGGVGSTLVQMAKLKNHKVFGVVGNPNKKDFVMSLGADMVVSKKEVSWEKEARSFSADGFQIVLDANGAETLGDSYKLLSQMGKLISYGFHTMLPKDRGTLNWPKLIFNFLKTPRFSPIKMTEENKSLVTFNLSFLFGEKEVLNEAMNDIVEWIQSESVKPPKITTYEFSNIAQAHKDIESGNTMGKLVIKV
jgi:NADPH:quinone reductase-like Zn-dependent oxidoreductase